MALNKEFVVSISKPKEWVQGYKDGYSGLKKVGLRSNLYIQGFDLGLQHKDTKGKRVNFD